MTSFIRVTQIVILASTAIEPQQDPLLLRFMVVYTTQAGGAVVVPGGFMNRHEAGLAKFEELFALKVPDNGGLWGQVAIDLLFGEIWTRPGLSLRDRSMITVATLIAQGRTDELELHLRGALNVGISEDEINEMITHLSFYAGFPAGRSALSSASKVFSSRKSQADTK